MDVKMDVVSRRLVSGRSSFCYDGKYTSQSGAELFKVLALLP